MIGKSVFTVMDYIVLLATFLGSVAIGVYYGMFNKQKTNADLLVGGRDMPILPTALSLLATYMSPILVLGYAGEIYSYGTLLVETILGTIIFVPIAALVFLPVMYPLKLTSAYEYLEYRFESRAVRVLAALTFVCQITSYMGVVLYAPALALNAVVNFPIWIVVAVMGITCAIYTAVGGLKAVVWTDVFQMLIMLAGMFAIVIGGAIRVGGYTEVFRIADDHQRIKFFKFNFDFFERLNSINILLGNGVMVFSVCGCQQTAVQRYSSISTLKKAVLSIMITLPLVVFTVGLAGLAGVVIFANYADCDPITLGFIKRNDQISPYFVQEFLSSTQGLMGLFMACLFSASLSTVSSGLNALTAVTWEDFLVKTKRFKNISEKAQGRVSKIVGLTYGILCIMMAYLAGSFDGVLGASIILNGSVAGPLLGIFLLGLLVPFANKWGAIVGMLVGHIVTIWVCLGAALLGRKPTTLPYSVESCSAAIWDEVGKNKSDFLSTRNTTMVAYPELDWPQKIHTVSFLLYPVIGCTVCLVVGIIVSIISGFFSGVQVMVKPEQYKYVHPLLAKFLRRGSKSAEFTSNGKHNNMELSSSSSCDYYAPSTTTYASETSLNGNSTYTKRGSSFNTLSNGETGDSNKNTKYAKTGYHNNGFKET